MKILLITSVYKEEVVGPARFARLLESNSDIDTHILTTNVEETSTLKSVNINYPWWQKKLNNYFSISLFSKRINELKSNYDVLLFNSSILVNHHQISSPYIVMVNDEKLVSLKLSYNFDYFRRTLNRRIEKRAVRNAEKVIVNSDYLKDKIASIYKVDIRKIYTLHKGISMENKMLEYQDTLPKPKNHIKVLFVKNDFVLGGLNELIKALGGLNDFSFRLTIIGTDQSVKKWLNIYPNISYEVMGYQSNNDVVKAMYANDIHCTPSRFETLGVAIMEGLAVGIPTITTGVGGLPEVTENGKHVWQCKPNNPQSIASQILECIRNPELRKAKSKSGKIYVHNKFDFKKVVERLKAIINSPPTS